MRNDNKELRTDLSFLLLLVLIFICNVFIILNDQFLMENFAILLVAYVIVIITYFTNLTAGLIINSVVIMVAITYLIVMSVVKGIPIERYVYFWIVMMPSLTAAFSLYSASARGLQKRVTELNDKLILLSTIDEKTHYKNLRMFENDGGIKISIARRYNIKFAVVVIRFRYQKEIEMFARKEGVIKTAILVSKAIEGATRLEDELYHVEDEPMTFALLMLTNKKRKGMEAIHQRIKEGIAKIDTSAVLNTRKLILDTRIGFAFDDGTKNVMELLEDAKDSMQYDV